MQTHGEKARALIAMTVARTWKDATYRNSFLKDPRAVLEQEGLDLPENLTVQVVEETATIRYIDLSCQPDERASTSLDVVISESLPLTEGQELRIVQSTDRLLYAIIPPAPTADMPGGLAEMAVARIASTEDSDGTTTVTEETVVVVAAEAVEVATTEAEEAETTTTVTAEAEAVVVIVLT